MKYLIKIDRASIRKNEEASPTNCIIDQTFCFSCEKIPNFLIDGENCRIVSCEDSTQGTKVIRGYFYDKSLERRLIREGIPTSSYTAMKELKCIPSEEEKYSYNYQNQKIKCDACGKQFYLLDLKEAESQDESYSDTVCPYCGEIDCCELEYEKINLTTI